MKISNENISIIFNQNTISSIIEYLNNDENNFERICFVLCSWVKNGENYRYFAYEVYYPGKEDILSQSKVSIVPKQDVQNRLLNKCLTNNFAFISIHSHPFAENSKFSFADDKADRALNNIIKNIYPELPPFVSVLVSKKDISARFINDSGEFVNIKRIAQIGLNYDYNILDNNKPVIIDFSKEKFDRQLGFIKEEGQRDLGDIKVLIVGLGGTGSIVAQQLSRLGVKNFYLCDEDKIEKSNLNRLIGAFDEDIGKYKIDVAEELILAIDDEATIKKFPNKFSEIVSEISEVDFIFGCVDSEAARLSLNETSVRFIIPYLDFGSAIFLENDKINGIKGQFRMVIPGETQCLICNNDINLSIVREELMEPEMKEAEKKVGYIVGNRQIPTPSVISLNSLIVSLGMIEFIKLISGYKNVKNYLFYDALNQRVESIKTQKKTSCPVCGNYGFVGLGNARQSRINYLPSQQDLDWLKHFSHSDNNTK